MTGKSGVVFAALIVIGIFTRLPTVTCLGRVVNDAMADRYWLDSAVPHNRRIERERPSLTRGSLEAPKPNQLT
ncbi:hypothetical protein B296_00043666 [Ensete ventricosum]|uniref:Uncharacterized protein n=1 Tax=Ensete ventricosum TaxID=4639 RepID=A0A426XYK6_ENSVE|nr:hypothetical protein B296_00043666 [Ensete ventricosum]